MSDLKNILAECSIADIYGVGRDTSVLYKIPVYQRNYAWERDEICALIKDVYDSMSMGKPVYYIGTLVAYKRDENVFEVIDGQQRLTTIYLILNALGVIAIPNKLTYSARKISASTLNRISEFTKNRESGSGKEDTSDVGNEKDWGIVRGLHFAEDSLDEIVGVNPAERAKFRDYFLENVHIVHYRVPKDVDLNHYFEVMNSRGEQLEKHEIIKAKLSEQLIGDDVAMEKFSLIWEACSDMNFYIQQKLSFAEMKSVFGNNMDSFVLATFDDFPCISANTDRTVGMKSVEEFLEVPAVRTNQKQGYDENDRFQPVIDFPNFLLIVLKITVLKELGINPVLDDKELLNEFGKVRLTPCFVKQFGYNLLKAKYYLDNYVVHHVNGAEQHSEKPWKLQRYVKHGSNAYVNLIEDKEEKLKQSELVQLLSMFEVTFTPKQRKNYLFYCLYHLFADNSIDDYIVFLRKLADKYFFDIYLNPAKLNERNQPKPNSFDETIVKDGNLNVELENVARDFRAVYPKGMPNIPLYVFNYTDYKLWKKYADELRGERTKKGDEKRIRFFSELGCSDFELDLFRNFYFSRTRKSLEHYFPQAKAGEGKPVSCKDINCFGNFAMIGADANSSGSDWNPVYKKERYLDSKSNQVSVASLKFRIMLQMCQDNYDKGCKDESFKRASGLEWNPDDMDEHEDKMLGIIMQPS